MTTYKGLQIVPKLDFGRTGFLIDGHFVKEGYVVTDGLCNVMPGAIWFQTVKEAQVGIDVYHITGETQRFHTVYHEIDKAQECATLIVLEREQAIKQAELTAS